MSRAKLWDELWVAEKFQSNSVIAGSPRNIFRYSLVMATSGRALNGYVGRKFAYRTKLRMLVLLYNGSQTVGAKLHMSKGKQPRSQSKVLKSMLSVKGGRATQTARRLA